MLQSPYGGGMIKNRKHIQYVFALLTFFALVYNWISLFTLLVIATLLGVLFGKVFCKWMCPMGLVKESLNKNMSEEASKINMYNYYKVGCPISWIQGLTNKFSLFKIKLNKSECVSCGICDKTCYITTLSKEHSFYKENKQLPGEAFNCSKCLKCVESCPQNSLTFSLKTK